MEWNYDLPIKNLPEDISEIFSNEAKYLLRDLNRNKLVVMLVDAPNPRFVDHKIRVAIKFNPEWYRKLFHSHDHIKRKRVISALERIAKKEDRTFKVFPFLYDSRMRELIYLKTHLIGNYNSAMDFFEKDISELKILSSENLYSIDLEKFSSVLEEVCPF